MLPTWEGDSKSRVCKPKEQMEGCRKREKKTAQVCTKYSRTHGAWSLLIHVCPIVWTFGFISSRLPRSPICNRVVETSGCARFYAYALGHHPESPSCLGIGEINTWMRSSLIRIPYSTNEPQFEMLICNDFVISSMGHGTTREISPLRVLAGSQALPGFMPTTRASAG